jgi:hypothetical protein
MKTGAIDYVVLTIALLVFLYSFFIAPHPPIYWDNTSIHPPPSDAIRLENGSYIVGFEHSAVEVIAPIVFIIYLGIILYAETHDGELPRIRDMHLISKFKNKCKDKINEGKEQYRDWRK